MLQFMHGLNWAMRKSFEALGKGIPLTVFWED
jgi:hypothetical protein